MYLIQGLEHQLKKIDENKMKLILIDREIEFRKGLRTY